MQIHFLYIVFGMLSVFSSGCRTFNGSVELNTFPKDAEIYVKQNDSERLLGKSPIKINLSEVASSQAIFVNFEVRYDGYQSHFITIPSNLGDFNHQINLNLNKVEQKSNSSLSDAANIPQVVCPKIEFPKMENQCEVLRRQKLANLAEGVAVVQSLIQKKEYELAHMKLSALVTEYANISILYDLMGNIRYLQRDYASALTAYKKSLGLNPQNSQISDIVKQLEQSTNQQMEAH